jgi:hypothetical protein
LKDPWAARDAYVDVETERTPQRLDSFFQTHQARPLDPAERTAALKLLEMQRHRMLMFTSCAWFFDEISGIETVTVLWSAARALQLSRDYGEALNLEQDFLSALSLAPSNIPDLKNGREVYRRFVTPVITDLARVAAHEAIETLFEDSLPETVLYCYRLKHLEKERITSDGNTLAVGRLHVASSITGESFETSYAAVHLGGHDVHCVLKTFPDLARHVEVRESILGRFRHGSITEVLALLYRLFDNQVYTLQDLLLEERRHLLGTLIKGVLGRYDPVYRSLVEENRRLIRMIKSADMPIPEAFRLALQYVLSRDLEISLAALPGDDAVRKLLLLREEAERYGLPLDWDRAADVLRRHLEELLRSFFDAFSAERARKLRDLLALGERLRLAINLWRLENMFFELSRGVFQKLAGDDRGAASDLGVRLRFPPLE